MTRRTAAWPRRTQRAHTHPGAGPLRARAGPIHSPDHQTRRGDMYQPPQPHQQVVKRGANHTLHLILTVCTCGIWAVTGWPIAAIMGRKKTVTTYAPPPQGYPPQQPYGSQQPPPQQWQQPPQQ